MGPRTFHIFGGGKNYLRLLRLDPRIVQAVVQSKSRFLYDRDYRNSLLLEIVLRGLFFSNSDRASKKVRNAREPDLRVA
jgi:hypothetical protein